MQEITRILKEHAKKYPRMQPQDAVKLLYQNEFGGGHLVRDKEACLQYLRREYASVAKDTAEPLLEDIGGGFVRVMLAALEEDALEKLGESFLRSAEIHKGSLDGFRQKLAILCELSEAEAFAFSHETLVDYLREYEKAGYPMVSHSENYRAAYRPAYRVVARPCLTL